MGVPYVSKRAVEIFITDITDILREHSSTDSRSSLMMLTGACRRPKALMGTLDLWESALFTLVVVLKNVDLRVRPLPASYVKV